MERFSSSFLDKFRPKRPLQYKPPDPDKPLPGFPPELLVSRQIEGFVGVYKTDDKTVVKYGDHVRESEAAAMRFVAEKTSIPVPKVYEYHLEEQTKCGYLAMEYIEGEMLQTAWDKLDAAAKSNILKQLKDYMLQLRSITGDFVGSVDRTRCQDTLFDGLGKFGPYEDEAAFKAGLIKALKRQTRDEDRQIDAHTELCIRWIEEVPISNRLVLTHNDFAPRNIMVKDGKVAAIIDWQDTGFYPEYWEYVKAYGFVLWDKPWMKEHWLEMVLEPYSRELAYLKHTIDLMKGWK